MVTEIHALGGFSECGRNMSAVKIGDDVFTFDCGFHIPSVIELQEQEEGYVRPTEKKLRRVGAVADDILLDKRGLRGKVRAMLLGHAHLDHIGGIPYLAPRYNAPVVGTSFTMALLKEILNDEHIQLRNKLVSINPNKSFTIRGKKRNYRAEFIHMTHSIPQTALLAVHTPDGVIVYANDFKIDNTPVMGNPPNYNAMKRIAKEGVKALIIDSLYSGTFMKTPSERVARNMVEETLLTIRNEKSAIFVPTFSSHIARIKSIVDFGKKLNRKIYLVGRSLNKYVRAAEKTNLAPFKKDVTLVTYSKQVQSTLSRVSKDRRNSLVVCTGHQGEPGSIMDRLSRKQLPFEFRKNDNIIFSSKTIPVPVNIANKGALDKRLRKFGVRIFDEVHVSGHGAREDMRELVNLLQPEHIIPSHGSVDKIMPMIDLANEMGYRSGKQTHLMQNGQVIKI